PVSPGAGPAAARRGGIARGGRRDEPREGDVRVRGLRPGLEAALRASRSGTLRVASDACGSVPAVGALSLLPRPQGRRVQRVSRVPVHQSRRRARSLLRAAGGGLLLRAGEEGGRAAARAAARAETRRAGRAEETRRGGSGAPAAARAGGGTQAAAADLAVDRAARDPARVRGDDE